MNTLAPRQWAGAMPAEQTQQSTKTRPSPSSGMDPRIQRLRQRLARLEPADFPWLEGYDPQDFKLFAWRIGAGVAYYNLLGKDWQGAVGRHGFDVGDRLCCVHARVFDCEFVTALTSAGLSQNQARQLGLLLPLTARTCARYALLTAMWMMAGAYWRECCQAV